MRWPIKCGLERNDYLNFQAIDKFEAQQTALATTCKMRRPERQLFFLTR